MTKINVTAEDIANGEPGNAKSCPIARAIHRVKGFEGAAVTTRRVISQDLVVTMLPMEAIHFIHSFDADWPVDPFTFEIPGRESDD